MRRKDVTLGRAWPRSTWLRKGCDRSVVSASFTSDRPFAWRRSRILVPSSRASSSSTVRDGVVERARPSDAFARPPAPERVAILYPFPFTGGRQTSPQISQGKYSLN